MRKSGCTIILGLLLLGLGVSAAYAQNARGTILGHIKDASGAPVSGATVTLVNVNTNFSSTLLTTDSGDYIFLNLTPDTYVIKVEVKGFKAANAANLIVEVDHTLRQDFSMEIGTLSESVSVNATAQMLQTDNATIGQVMNQQFVENLPLNGRDFTSLIQFNAGVTQPSGGVQTADSGLVLHGLNGGFSEYSVNGARASSNSYLIDGIVDNNFLWGTASASPSIDAIQEFKLQNGLYSAEYGDGSAQINVAIKSGTNQYHGSAYDFVRNSFFQPENKLYAAVNKAYGIHLPLKNKFEQNQFGMTLGGPIRLPKLYDGKDRSFFFVAYEGGRRAQSSTQSVMVPTAPERQGNFSDWPFPIYDPSTTGSVPASPGNPTGRQPYANNTIPSSAFNPIALNFLKYFPSPNITCQLPCANLVGYLTTLLATNNVTARLDQVLTSRDQLSGTLIWSHDNEPQPSILPANGSVSFDRDILGGLEWTHAFGSQTLNVVRFGGNRRFFHEGASTSYGPDLSSEAGLKNAAIPSAFAGIPTLNPYGGYAVLGNANNGFTQVSNVFQFVDNLGFVRGKHNFTTGVDIRRKQLSNLFNYGANGSLTFAGGYTASDPSAARSGQIGPTAGNGFADLLLGDPLYVAGPNPFGYVDAVVRNTDWNFFFQDSYHVSSRVTLNLGLRYEIPEQWHSTDDSGSVFNPNTPGGGQSFASRAFVQSAVPNPVYFQCCAPKTLIPTDYGDLAPRLGLTWRPSSDRLVLRAGYGVFYDTSMEYYNSLAYNDNIYQELSPTIYPQATGFEKVSPVGLNSLWLPVTKIQPGSTLSPPYLFAAGGLYWKNKTPRNQQWTLDAQYAFNPDLMLDVAYVGVHGSRQPAEWYFNGGVAPRVAGDPCNFILDRSLASPACLADPNFQPVQERVPYPNFSSQSVVRGNVGWSNYNALQVRLEKRFSHDGLQFFANYTFSRNRDVISATDEVGGMGSGEIDFQDPHNFAADYGPSTLNIPQRLSLSYLYEVPIGRGHRWSLGKANYIVGGWKVSGDATFASGLPFTLYAFPGGTDQSGIPEADRIRVNITKNPNSGFRQSLLEWFDVSAVSAPISGTYGNLGRNTLRGTSQRVGDISFMKDISITDRGVKLQYRLDIFNFLSSIYASSHIPYLDLSSSAPNCTRAIKGTCYFGSMIPENGFGTLNWWNPRVMQMALKLTW